MRILKIIDGFVSNSSSQYGTVIIAVRKGENLPEVFRRNNMSTNLESYFEQDMDEIESICKSHINLDYLRAKYNFYIGSFHFRSWGDEDYENEEGQGAFDEFWYLREKDLKDMMILYCYEGL